MAALSSFPWLGSAGGGTQCLNRLRNRRPQISAAMASGGWVQFPHAPPPLQSLLESMSNEADRSLDLLPSSTPEDVTAFQSSRSGATGSFVIREGSKSSKVKFALGSWLHCLLPGGSGSIDITTLLIMLRPQTKVPHFLLEFIQSSPSTAVMVLDLVPRKDMVDDPAYLDRFYESTQLDKLRQQLHDWPGSQPYISPSLYVRTAVSPASLLFRLSFSSDEELDKHICSIIAKAFALWMEQLQESSDADVEDEAERNALASRDLRLKIKAIEIDLRDNLPKLFDQEIADRVIAAYRKYD